MKTQKERLMKFIAYTEMSKSAFERAAGLSASSLIHAGDDLTAKMIDRICLAFPTLNPDWLKSGDGIMLRDSAIISAPVFNNHGDNVQNEQNVISKEIIDMLRAKDAQIDRAMDQTDRLIANLEKSISSIEVLVQHITNGGK